LVIGNWVIGQRGVKRETYALSSRLAQARGNCEGFTFANDLDKTNKNEKKKFISNSA
jgi:hypothetical protein